MTKRHMPTARVLFLALFFGAALFAPYLQAVAQERTYTVKDIEVDVSADNAVSAREAAIAQAQQDAFRELAAQFLSAEEMAQFAPPSAVQIGPLIRDYEVQSERLSATRYQGTFSFRFEGDAVQRFFRQSGVTYSDVRGKPILILPYYQTDTAALLWRNNPFREAWNRQDTGAGLLPVMVPIGDLEDVRDTRADTPLSLPADILAGMAARYGASETFIALAAIESWQPGPDGQSAPARVAVRLYGSGGPEGTFLIDTVRTTMPYEGQGHAAFMEAIMDQAVRKTYDRLQEKWRRLTAVGETQAERMKVSLSFNGLAEWSALRQRLNDVSAIESVDILSLRPGTAEISLSYRGGEQRLQLALAQADFALSAIQDASYGFQQKAPRYRLVDQRGRYER